jgi:hypothetical protein
MVRVLTGVGHGDLVDFIGVKPDLALAALKHAGGEPLLELQGNHLCRRLCSSPAYLGVACVAEAPRGVQGFGRGGAIGFYSTALGFHEGATGPSSM